MSQYLLEKSRVVAVGEGERNYHAFYHLVGGHHRAGRPPEEAAALELGAGVRGFRYLSCSSVLTVAALLGSWLEGAS